MELRDLIVTPIVLILIYGVAFGIRSSVTDVVNRVYFIPALTVKMIGALALGFIYQFYYDGGDTYMYHTYADLFGKPFWDSPSAGLKLLFSDGLDLVGIYKYISNLFLSRSTIVCCCTIDITF
ncbi:MAG: hypothetical protein IPJ20_24590 [Flammeovirgaceae bacterium]|nr:hypothetical protein [Flammeovirgaceae bacterium]